MTARLTDRLAAAEQIIQSATPDIHHTIVWRLIGTLSYCAQTTHAKDARHAAWLMTKFEEAITAHQKHSELV